ncbi:MAG: glycosyltransferase family 2 protein [Erysipelotrichia bacterium]|nr:glycosyltransferase family 2 protein [Erysipelotrichia bacterium]
MSYLVTIIVPVLNEENYIEELLTSIERQSYPFSKFEVFIIDGCSSDNTIKKINAFIPKSQLNISMFENPKQSQASAMNIGIRHSSAKYIIRLDAHANYQSNYIEAAVELLEETGADNVGFYIESSGKNQFAKRVARIQSSKFGVGNSNFRTENTSTVEADTVPFGAFKRETLIEIDGFDERFLCNEDNDINNRILKKGGKILLSDRSGATYYARDNLSSLVKMSLRNGKWNIISLFYNSTAMRLRHFVPLLFTSSIIFCLILSFFYILFKYLLIAEILLYTTCSMYYSKSISKSISDFFYTISLFFIFHFTYGLGSLIGIFNYINLLLKEKNNIQRGLNLNG